MEKDEIDKIVLLEKERSLHIARVPKSTKELFIGLSKEEFSEDYGMTLKWCLEQALEYQNMKPLLFNMVHEQSNPTGEEKPVIKTMSGRIVERGLRKNE